MEQPKKVETKLLRVFELTTRVAAESDPLGVCAALLDTGIELSGAEEGYVVTVNTDGEFGPVVGRVKGKEEIPDAWRRVSRTIVRGVMERREPLLFKDMGTDPEVRTRSSLCMRSAIVAPLLAHDTCHGAIILEIRSRGNAFDPSCVPLVQGLAGSAAVALESAYQRKQLRLLVNQLSSRLDPSSKAPSKRGKQAKVHQDGARLVGHFDRLVGRSPRFLELLVEVEKALISDQPVLILGPSGSGKEEIARTLHDYGPNKGRVFVPVNSAELVGDLAESTLFGHVRGAFTGAERDRQGLVTVAKDGTLFLDEVGDMPLDCQAKLLRFLEDGSFRQVGGEKVEKSQCRILAATNKNLGKLVKAGKFREDLYYRLRVFEIDVPPLSARREDIGLLVDRFLAFEAARGGVSRNFELRAGVLELLEAHDWPGNVRELKHACARAVAVGATPLDFEEFGIQKREVEDPTLKATEEAQIRKILQQTGGKIQEAADLLKINRGTLWRKMKKYKID